MNELLMNVLEAHGGLNRWNRYQRVETSIVTGGGFFALKGVLQIRRPDACPCGCTKNVHLFRRLAPADSDTARG